MALAEIRQGLIGLTESGCVPYGERKRYLERTLAGMPVEEAVRLAISESKSLASYQAWEDQYPTAYYLEQYAQREITCVTILDDTYPQMLLEISKPPLVLFVQGHVEWLQSSCLAVVGARNAPHHTKRLLNHLFPPLAGKLTIVSGLARGVDRWSHECAISHHLPTIGVIGTGLAHVYPKENHCLQTIMAQEQCVVSALPLHAGVRRWQFPFRNEILAGLSLATLVVAAKQESGSLITANYALQYNREVMAVPGQWDDPYSVGGNRLIQAGALLVMDAEDILTDLTYLLEQKIRK
ncbi:MAG: DNA-processing protein DprA [Aerococcus sp.]|nr:DNA-processing protein DprA [Aerococcus sp.]